MNSNWKGIVMMIGAYLLFSVGGLILINGIPGGGGEKSALEPVVHAAAPAPIVVSLSDPGVNTLVTGYINAISKEYLPAKHRAREVNTYSEWYRVSGIAQRLAEYCRMRQPWEPMSLDMMTPDLELLGKSPDEAMRHYKNMTWHEMHVFGACYKALSSYGGRDIEP